MGVMKGNKGLYVYEISDQLAENLRRWLDRGLVELGGITNFKLNQPNSGYCNLKLVHDDRYLDGQVYEGLGPEWIWESVSPIGANPPFQVSGVYVNSTFYPIGTSGQYSHNIDYERGRVVFNTPITGAKVQCEYSMRDVAVYLTDSPQWKTIINNYVAKYDQLDTLSPSGMAEILKENRVWLPAVFIDIQDRTNKALQLGGGEISDCTVFYHIFSDKAFMNKRIADILNNQLDVVLDLYDINNAPFPYNSDGTLYSGAIPYPNLANRSGPYFWTFARINSTQGGTTDDIYNLYRAEVRQSVTVDRYLSTY